MPILLRFGFPLDFPDEARALLKSVEKNHTSATQYPKGIEKYIDTKRKFHAIFCPYNHAHFSKNSQVSPFMSRPKPDS